MKLQMNPFTSSQTTGEKLSSSRQIRNRKVIRGKLRYAILLLALALCILPPGLYSQDLTWMSIQPLLLHRTDHGAATGPDGLVYIVGGSDGSAQCYSSMEQYDPKISGSSWSAGLSEMNIKRSNVGVVCGADGYIYAIGGNCGAVTDVVERYNTATGAWESVRHLNHARSRAGVAVGPDLRIYATGGFDATGDVSEIEAYDAATGEWTDVATTAQSFRHAVTGLDGKIYIFGDGPGATWATFDGSTLVSKGAVTPASNGDFSVVTGSDGLIYLSGVGIGNRLNPANQVVAYDADGESSIMIPSLIQSRSGGASAAAEGQLFVTGGFRGGNVGTLKFAETYGPLKTPLFPNAVTWLRFEESNIFVFIRDETKNIPSGTIIGSPFHGTGRVAKAMLFNGLNQGIKFNDSPKINFGKDSFTIESWVKWSPTVNSISTILDKRTRTGGNSFRGYHLFIFADGRLGVQLANGTTFANYLTTSDKTKIQPDQWAHIAVTVDRNSPDKNVRLYVNGVLNDISYTPLAGNISNTAPLTIALHSFSKLPFKGAIDELTMYNRALRWAEIRAVFLAGKVGKKL